MCSDLKIIALGLILIAVSCSQTRRIDSMRRGEIGMSLNVPDEGQIEEEQTSEILVDSIRSTLEDEPFIMNAIRDAESGEWVATDVIKASKVTARFRNVAERSGYVSICFDVRVPAQMSDSKWKLKLLPVMSVFDEKIPLEPVFITGDDYREGQLKGYERYQRFLASIITDSTEFIRERQLDIFLRRHFPHTYAMKTDSSYVPEPQAVTLFGTTQTEALQHYTMNLRKRMNEKRKGRASSMLDRYVKDPIIKEGIRLDTVVNTLSGDFVYRYTHTFRSRPRLRKVIISLDGSLYEDGKQIAELPMPEHLTFYISSLSTLVDDTPRYRMLIIERMAYDNTKAFLDFRQGSAVVDTTLGDNASELRRIRRCIGDVAARTEYALDSLLIVASCSPEGDWALNRRLSAQRSEAVREYLMEYVPDEWRDSLKTSEIPENWDQLEKLVRNDNHFHDSERKKLLKIIKDRGDPDAAERNLSYTSEYRYLREKIYPKLRSVSFDFYLHRTGMVKDTVHTMEIDSLYMAGVTALRNLDYKQAVTLLRPYKDYNSALAFMSADYNHSALEVLKNLDDRDPRVCYLKAIVLSRLGVRKEALKYLDLGIAYDPSLKYRANLDPELNEIVKGL